VAEIGQTPHNLRNPRFFGLTPLKSSQLVYASEISRVEKGERNPSLGTVIRLVKGLEIPVEALSNRLRVSHCKSKHPREVEKSSKLELEMQRLLIRDILPLVERMVDSVGPRSSQEKPKRRKVRTKGEPEV
jgi:transcriptional regulator with XRE-family HTH domain